MNDQYLLNQENALVLLSKLETTSKSLHAALKNILDIIENEPLNCRTKYENDLIINVLEKIKDRCQLEADAALSDYENLKHNTLMAIHTRPQVTGMNC